MILAPPDRVRGKRIREAAVMSTRAGEGFYPIGFDWQPLAAFSEFDDALSFMDEHRMFMEFRAVAYVRATRNGWFRTVIVEIGGEPNPYAVRAKISGTQTSVDWAKPDPLDARALSLLAQGK